MCYDIFKEIIQVGLIKSFDEEAFANYVCYILESNLTEHFGAQARIDSFKFDIKKTVKEYQRIFEDSRSPVRL